MGYAYYNQRTTEGEPGRPHRRVAEAKRVAAFRLDPSLNDVDSLIYLHRRSVLEGWLNELPSGIDVLDVGGRIQPYRSLIEPKSRTYFGLDLQFDGTVDVVASAEVVRRIGERFPLAPVDPNYGGEVAGRWRYLDGAGEVGVISSVTEAFCSTCTRARISTDGQLYTCLFAARGYDLKALVRGGADDAQVAEAVRAIWQRRDDRYSEIRTAETAKARKVEMSFIGG